MRRVLSILSLLLITLTVSAQEEYLKGRDFWTTSAALFYSRTLSSLPIVIQQMHYQPDTTVLYVFGDTACTGYVENPNTGFFQTFNVTPGVETILKIPSEHGMWDLPYDWFTCQNHCDTIFQSGIHVVTNRNVVVKQLTNTPEWIYEDDVSSPVSTQKLDVWPTHLYGAYSNLFWGTWWTMCLCVLATEDNSFVNIKVSGNIISQRILQKGETLIFMQQPNSDRNRVLCVESDCKTVKCFFVPVNDCVGGEPKVLYHGRFNNRDFLDKKYVNPKLIKLRRPFFPSINGVYNYSLFDGMIYSGNANHGNPMYILGRGIFSHITQPQPLSQDAEFGFCRLHNAFDLVSVMRTSFDGVNPTWGNGPVYQILLGI